MGTGPWVWVSVFMLFFLQLVLRGFKDVLTIDAANHNVVDSCGTLVSCCAWHSK